MAGTLTATAYAQLIGTSSAPFIGEGTLTAIAPHGETLAALAGGGALSAVSYPRISLAPALAGAGTLSASASPIMAAAGALTGAGALTAAATGIMPAPAFDAVGTPATTTSAVTVSGSHTAAAGATVLAFLSVAAAGRTISSFTYGGLAMTLVTNLSETGGQFFVYQLTNAPGGAQTVTPTISAATAMNLQTLSYTHVSTVGTPATVTGLATTTAGGSQALTCAANQIIVQGFSIPSSNWTATGGGTLRYNGKTAINTDGLAIQDSAASATFTATPAGNGSYGGIGIVLS